MREQCEDNLRDSDEEDEEYDMEEENSDDEDDDEFLDENGMPKFKVETTTDKNVKDGLAKYKGAGIAVEGPRVTNVGPKIMGNPNLIKSAPPRNKTPASIIGASPALIARGIGGLNTNWNVPDTIPWKPDFYELEQTATFVPNAKASLVAYRISESLRALSIHGNFDDENAKVIAVTEDSAEFKVQLYAGKGEYSHGTIVEIQKLRGTARNYNQIIAMIFKASQGEPFQETPKLNVNSINFGEFGIDINDDQAFESSKRTIKICGDMVREGFVDGVLLGLERLSTLVDVSKLGSSAALRNSDILLHSAQGDFIRFTIKSLIEESRLPNGGNNLDKYEIGRLRKLSYFILSNALSVVCEEGRFLLDSSAGKWFVGDLINFLIADIKDAEENPHEAYMASKCLLSLVKADAGAMQKAQSLQASVALTVAQFVGKNRHALLLKQSSDALEVLAE